MSKPLIDADRIFEIFEDCLLSEHERYNEEKSKTHIDGLFLNRTYIFSTFRLQHYKQEIRENLLNLPQKFLQSVGGGWSFLNACLDKNGLQWGEQQNVEQLLVLGLGLNLVEFCLPRPFWNTLPGGVPYFMVKDKESVDSLAEGFVVAKQYQDEINAPVTSVWGLASGLTRFSQGLPTSVELAWSPGRTRHAAFSLLCRCETLAREPGRVTPARFLLR